MKPRPQRAGGAGGPGAVHRGLVGERALVGTSYLANPELRRQYEAEIAPRTRAALARILAEHAGRLAGVRRVLDLGAGTGAAGLAVRAGLGAAIEVVSVDRVAATAGAIVADLRQPRRPPGVEGRFDLVVAAHLLNELGLPLTERAAVVYAWARELLAEGGHLLLLEPALQATSRDLLQLRDRLVPAGFFVVAPCLYQGACPALERERDWCHASAPWLPEDAGSRAGRSRVDYSYLLLSRAGEPATDRRLFRVVSDPLPEKGRLRIFGCGPAGRHPLVRLDRERSAENQELDQVARGDLLVAGPTEKAGDGLRITQATKVQRR
jgi:ribosomal protein RSM22 (predicted rRNA methylase)